MAASGSPPGDDPARFARVKDLFLEALEKPPAERETFLRGACGGDDALHAGVEELLASHQEDDGFLEQPALPGGWVSAFSGDAGTPAEGRQIGVWQLVREIGHGGMGTVFLARRADAQFQMEAALKLVRHGVGMMGGPSAPPRPPGGEDVLRRFRNERQILASFQHPNIARLLDGGTTDHGVPYFVMEYVDGIPITEYCDQKCLRIEDRLRLFRAVLAAVQEAHQRLVVHRDIKPGNILVTRDGVPKLLDFGIAKPLMPDFGDGPADATRASMRLMTPDYASPEQVRGEPVTTLTDIYSLGVVLYELLTGRRPYRLTGSTLKELERVVCEEEPVRPSTAVTKVVEIPSGADTIQITPASVSEPREGSPERLRRRLEGDVDAIVMKALRKEPSARYQSVAQLADDIDRHLGGQPVLARRGTTSYRVAKLVRRHRVAVTAAALVVLSLLGGILATARQARIASRERERAERRFQDVRKLADAYLFEFDAAIESLPGARPARELLVKRALEYLASLAEEAGDDVSLQRDLAKAYDKIGGIQGNPYVANLGNTAGALQSYRKAQEIREALIAASPRDPELRSDLAASFDRAGEILSYGGDVQGALQRFRQALALRQSLAAEDAANPRARRGLAVSHLKIGDSLFQTGDVKAALVSHRSANELLVKLAADQPGQVRPLVDLGVSHSKIGALLDVERDDAGALEWYRKALETSDWVLKIDPLNAFGRRNRAISLNCIGDAQQKLGQAAAAAESHRLSLAICEELLAADTADSRAKLDVGYTLGRLGRALTSAGQPADALPKLRRGLEICGAVAAAEPTNTYAAASLVEVREVLAAALGAAGQRDAAVGSLEKAVAERTALSQADLKNAAARHDLAESLLLLGDALAALRRFDDAQATYARSLAIWEELRAAGTLSSRQAARPVDLRDRMARMKAG